MVSYNVSTGLSADSIESAVLEGLPENVIGNDEWATTVTRGLVRRLLDAMESGQYSQFTNVIRVVARAPSKRDIRLLANAVCDAAVTQAIVTGHEDERLFDAVAHLRKGANDLLDRSLDSAPHAATASATITACDTILQLVAVSRPDLRAHLDAVCSLGVRIGRQLDISAENLEAIRLGGLLHDIGLLTTGTDPALAERDPAHPAVGDRSLAGIEALRHVAPVVRSHHERFDGAGQPDGLRGAEIPLEARIIAVADAFEHLANRAGSSNPIAAAISDLWQESGGAFDPDVVAAVTRMFNQHWRIRRTASGQS